jgi:hypothetical protein
MLYHILLLLFPELVVQTALNEECFFIRLGRVGGEFMVPRDGATRKFWNNCYRTTLTMVKLGKAFSTDSLYYRTIKRT